MPFKPANILFKHTTATCLVVPLVYPGEFFLTAMSLCLIVLFNELLCNDLISIQHLQNIHTGL
jgi:hypothetical protein